MWQIICLFLQSIPYSLRTGKHSVIVVCADIKRAVYNALYWLKGDYGPFIFSANITKMQQSQLLRIAQQLNSL